MNKPLTRTFLPLLLLWFAATGCSGGSFEIDINLENYAGNVRAFYLDDAGSVATPVAKVKQGGHWSLSCSASEPTLVSIVSSENQLLAQVVAQNGDHITIDGDAMRPFRHRIGGSSELTNQWAEWRRQHADLFDLDDPKKINAAIAEYIEKNPDNPLATILLVADYRRLNDRNATRRLLGLIKPEARLPRLLVTLDRLTITDDNPPRHTMSMKLMEHGGEFVNFIPQKEGKHWLLIFWDKDVRARREFITRARRFVAHNPTRLRAADILASPDTITWGNIVRADSTRWQHFWAPAGTADYAIKYLHINHLPAFVATDSLGNILYAGHQLQPALDALQKKLSQ